MGGVAAVWHIKVSCKQQWLSISRVLSLLIEQSLQQSRLGNHWPFTPGNFLVDEFIGEFVRSQATAAAQGVVYYKLWRATMPTHVFE